jgi:hypothetical protein
MECESSLVVTLQQMLSLFTSGILLCLIIALVTLAIVQILQPFARGAVQYFLLLRWHSRAENEDRTIKDLMEGRVPAWIKTAFPDIEPLKSLNLDASSKFPKPDLGLLLRSVSMGFLMKRVQDAATLILARPSLSICEYRLLTSAASVEDRNAVLILDLFARHDPARLAALVNPPSDISAASAGASVHANSPAAGFAEAVAAAQQTVSAAAERHLDELQLQLEGSLAAYVRLLSIVTGMIVADLAAVAVSPSQTELPLIIGAVGGLLSSLLNDAARGLMARRR